MSAASSTLWSLSRSLLWLVVVVGIALGVGGLVAALDHPPGDATRPELTARQDRAAAGSIASLEVSMTPLADEVARLRGIGRDALTHVTQGDSGRLEADLAAGLAVLERAGSTVEGIRVVLAELPAGSARFGLSELDQERLAAVETVVAAVASLDETWRRVAPSDPGAAARVDEAVLAVESTGGAVEEARQALAGPAP